MDNIWFQSAPWMALALVAAVASLWITISAAVFEIVVGAIAGNTVGLPLTPWIPAADFLWRKRSFGQKPLYEAVVLTRNRASRTDGLRPL